MRHAVPTKPGRRSGGFRSSLPSLLTQAVPAKHARRSARAISEAAGNGFPRSEGPGRKCMPLANRSSRAYGRLVGRRRARSVAPHPLLAGLLFLTLLLRMMPGGYMLVASDDGWPRLALCSGVAALPSAGSIGPAEHGAHAGGHHHGPSPQHHQPQPAKQAEMPCPFAALAAPPLPPAPPFIAAALPLVAPLPLAAATPALRFAALAAPPPPATGPPLSV